MMFSHTLKQLRQLKRSLSIEQQNEQQNTEGFTLLEVLVVVAIVGFVSAIAAPSWSGFMNTQRAKDANERSFAAIRSAQSQAIQTRSNYRASFREETIDGSDRVQYAIHAATLTYGTTGIIWENLPEFSLLDLPNTTINDQVVSGKTYYYVEFDFQGNLADGIGGQGKIVFEATAGSNKQSCTIISTLIGGMRIASDNKCCPNNTCN